jgi:hypothetical protein
MNLSLDKIMIDHVVLDKYGINLVASTGEVVGYKYPKQVKAELELLLPIAMDRSDILKDFVYKMLK